MFIKGEVMKQSPYDLRYQVYADWAKWIELTLKKATFQYVPYNICNFLMGGYSCISDRLAVEKQMLYDLELSPALIKTIDCCEIQKKTALINEELKDTIKKLQGEVYSLRNTESQLNLSLQKLEHERQELSNKLTKQTTKIETYMSHRLFRLVYHLFRAYEKHIKKSTLY